MFKSPEILKAKCDSYFLACDAEKEPYTMTGLALYLGTNQMTLHNYRHNKYDNDEQTNSEDGAFQEVIEYALLKCENYAEKRLFGDKQVQGAIFSLKNNYGWKDNYGNDLTTGGEKITGFNYIIPNETNFTDNSADL